VSESSTGPPEAGGSDQGAVLSRPFRFDLVSAKLEGIGRGQFFTPFRLTLEACRARKVLQLGVSELRVLVASHVGG